jgi:hypothetical protein
VNAFAVRNPHPETSVAGLMEPIWYEDYAEPTWVWQSTGGSEEFEPKLSLTPLAIGTLKGTFYALFFAIPLGILGALYTSAADPRPALVKPASRSWLAPSGLGFRRTLARAASSALRGSCSCSGVPFAPPRRGFRAAGARGTPARHEVFRPRARARRRFFPAGRVEHGVRRRLRRWLFQTGLVRPA